MSWLWVVKVSPKHWFVVEMLQDPPTQYGPYATEEEAQAIAAILREGEDNE